MEKIFKNNVIMGCVALATLAIVAYVFVWKPYKASKGEAPVAPVG